MQRTVEMLVRQFEQGRLTRRQLVQALLLAAASPGLGQDRPVGAFRATGIDHVQITVSDLKSTRQFYEKLFGVTTISSNDAALALGVGSSGDYMSVQSESRFIKPIDHFGIAVENFSQDTALATIERVAPGAKTQKVGTTSVIVTGPEGVRVQIVPTTKYYWLTPDKRP